MRFSERIGKSVPRKTLQAGLDLPTKNRLWNIVESSIPYEPGWSTRAEKNSFVRQVVERVYDRLFKKPYSAISPGVSDEITKLEKWFTSEAQWFEVYDFLELVADVDGYLRLGADADEWPGSLEEWCTAFREAVNGVLSEEL